MASFYFITAMRAKLNLPIELVRDRFRLTNQPFIDRDSVLEFIREIEGDNHGYDFLVVERVSKKTQSILSETWYEWDSNSNKFVYCLPPKFSRNIIKWYLR